uniref:Uncharacterized protein n=1 Tax=Rhizophora mucronata TaxID=61149 RepID=A0A2P2JEM5_RHIMU
MSHTAGQVIRCKGKIVLMVPTFHFLFCFTKFRSWTGLCFPVIGFGLVSSVV